MPSISKNISYTVEKVKLNLISSESRTNSEQFAFNSIRKDSVSATNYRFTFN